MKGYILSIDQSTSGTKAVLFDRWGKLVHRCTFEHFQYYPQPGWVEHDAEEIFRKTLEAIRCVLEESGIPSSEVRVLSITNQRETAVVWDRITGKPVHHAIVWQCQRGTGICNELKTQGFDEPVRRKTGLVLSPYFTAAKVKWILDHVEGARQMAQEGRLLMGTVDSWLLWKLTGGRVHATDYSNASRTQLFNIHELRWDRELLDIFTIPESMMPEVRFSDELFGVTEAGGILEQGVPVSGILGDSHAALFGQNCFEKGMAKATYGTGSSIMLNIGKKALQSEKGVVTSLAWGQGGEVEYVLEGNINCTGATIKWLVDDLGLIAASREAGEIAPSVENTGGVYIVPAFVGLGAPYWDSEARAILCGITRGTRKAHIVRAAEESIAYQIKDVLDLMAVESGIQLKELRVDGGPTRDDFLMQFQADILDVAVVRARIEELSALGSAFMAGLAVGFWKDREEVKALRIQDAVFQSKMDPEDRRQLYAGWKGAVERALFKPEI